MTKTHLLFACIFTVIFSCKSPAQPPWEVGNTTLTEYDLVTGINLPWEILWGPDDYIWATLRSGQVLRIDPATGTFTQVLDINVMSNGNGEPGLLGMAMHPDWENTPKVFLVYCVSSFVGERLVAYDWDGANLINEQILFNDVGAANIHNGSRLLITEDDKILMTTGDNGDGGASSQNLNSYNGKILRLNLDGSVPSDNPDPESYVWSFGHRNAQGLCQGPNGIVYSSEHGQTSHDELNIIEPNRNYGWPQVEGVCDLVSEASFCTENNVMGPLKEWSPCIAVNGIEYYNHPAIPEWQNSILLSVLGGLGANFERLSVLHLNDDGTQILSEDQFFSIFNQRIRDICINPYTGAVYVAFNGPFYPGGGPNTIKEFVNDGLSVNLIDRKKGPYMLVYPNPMKNEATVELSQSLLGTTLYVHDNRGKVVLEKRVDSTSFTFSKADLKSGHYYLSIQSEKGTLSKSLIVQ